MCFDNRNVRLCNLLTTKVKVYKSNPNIKPLLEHFFFSNKVRSIFSSRFRLKLLFFPSSCQNSIALTMLVRTKGSRLWEGWGLGRGPTLVRQQSQQRLVLLGTHNLILISLWRRTQRAPTTTNPSWARMGPNGGLLRWSLSVVRNSFIHQAGTWGHRIKCTVLCWYSNTAHMCMWFSYKPEVVLAGSPVPSVPDSASGSITAWSNSSTFVLIKNRDET